MSKSVRQPEKAPGPTATEMAEGEHEKCVPSKGGVELSKTEETTLNDRFVAISDAYKGIIRNRRDAANDLIKDVQVKDPPPGWQTVALACAGIALSAATAGVGGAVAAAIAGSVATSVGKVALKGVESAMKKAVTSSLDKGLAAAASTLTDATNPVDAFFRTQRDTIDRSSREVENAFTLEGRDKIRCTDDPLNAALAMLKATIAGEQVAQETQRKESLDAYLSLLSKADLGVNDEGTRREGTDLSDGLDEGLPALFDEEKGVLQLTVESGQSPNSDVKVSSAKLVGLNEALNNEIAQRPLNSLRIAVTVHGEVDPPSFWEEFSGSRRDPRGRFRFGENEAGTIWNQSTHGANKWLAKRANPIAYGPQMHAPGNARSPSSIREEIQKDSFAGIRSVLHDQLGPMSLAKMGVRLGD